MAVREENTQGKIENLSHLVNNLIQENIKLCQQFREQETLRRNLNTQEEIRIPRKKYSDSRRYRAHGDMSRNLMKPICPSILIEIDSILGSVGKTPKQLYSLLWKKN